MVRQYSLLDRFITETDRTLKTLCNHTHVSSRPYPAENIPAAMMDATTARTSARLLRVDHSGEVCAQALYQGQALTARNIDTQQKLQHAAREEIDHLAWCQTRITALHGRASLLNPLWYSGSFMLGVVAGWCGDQWSLGFLAETERQVTLHLEQHLQRVASEDTPTRAILSQMRDDEMQHATTAIHAGAHELPTGIKLAMRYAAKLMTTTAYWI